MNAYYSPAGLSAQAIAYGGRDHPWDPADLLRCVNYCERAGITVETLRRRMAGRSQAWTGCSRSGSRWWPCFARRCGLAATIVRRSPTRQ